MTAATPGTRAIERSLLLAASPLEVFAALRRPEGLAAWCADRVTEPGAGRLRLEWALPGGAWATELDVVEEVPGKRLAFRWAHGQQPTRVSFYLSPEGAGTRLVLVETGFGDEPLWDVVVEEEGEGWDETLARLVRLLGAGASRRIDKEAVLPAPPGRVLAALTREEELRRWLSPEARFEPRPGASYRLAAAGRGRVRALEPRRVALSWHRDPELPPTELTVELEQDPAGARLRLAHSAWGTGAEFNRAYEELDEAWDDALFLLRRYLVLP